MRLHEAMTYGKFITTSAYSTLVPVSGFAVGDPARRKNNGFLQSADLWPTVFFPQGFIFNPFGIIF
jgi:hypothetical protein